MNVWKAFKDWLRGLDLNQRPSGYETNVLSAIEERWGMFLRKIDDETIVIKNADNEYNKFKERTASSDVKDAFSHEHALNHLKKHLDAHDE